MKHLFKLVLMLGVMAKAHGMEKDEKSGETGAHSKYVKSQAMLSVWKLDPCWG